ncbi:uncharacterized protein LOC116253508 [Nymphaea colorata]|nr:uncharacterized protein LOC116253508 [Nymphaea colorata]
MDICAAREAASRWRRERLLVLRFGEVAIDHTITTTASSRLAAAGFHRAGRVLFAHITPATVRCHRRRRSAPVSSRRRLLRAVQRPPQISALMRKERRESAVSEVVKMVDDQSSGCATGT